MTECLVAPSYKDSKRSAGSLLPDQMQRMRRRLVLQMCYICCQIFLIVGSPLERIAIDDLDNFEKGMRAINTSWISFVNGRKLTMYSIREAFSLAKLVVRN